MESLTWIRIFKLIRFSLLTVFTQEGIYNLIDKRFVEIVENVIEQSDESTLANDDFGFFEGVNDLELARQFVEDYKEKTTLKKIKHVIRNSI